MLFIVGKIVRAIIYVDEFFRNSLRFDEDGLISMATGSEKTNIPRSVLVVGCISQCGINLIKKVDGRIDSEQFGDFLKTISLTAVEKFEGSQYPLVFDRIYIHITNNNLNF